MLVQKKKYLKTRLTILIWILAFFGRREHLLASTICKFDGPHLFIKLVPCSTIFIFDSSFKASQVEWHDNVQYILAYMSRYLGHFFQFDLYPWDHKTKAKMTQTLIFLLIWALYLQVDSFVKRQFWTNFRPKQFTSTDTRVHTVV